MIDDGDDGLADLACRVLMGESRWRVPAHRTWATSVVPAPFIRRADGETRTPDPFITSEVLYQLSYVGICRDFLALLTPGANVQGGCSKFIVGLCSRQG